MFYSLFVFENNLPQSENNMISLSKTETASTFKKFLSKVS